MNRTDLPTPLYAAAGAGDLAYRQLRKLPQAAARTAGQLRLRWAAGEQAALTARVRESAQRSGSAVAATAAAAQQRATARYRSLVAHGERVVAERAADRDEDQPQVQVEVGQVRSAGAPDQPADASSSSNGSSGQPRSE